VRDVMTKDVKSCFEDEDIKHVTRNLGDKQVRRLPIVNRTSVCSASSRLSMLPPARQATGPPPGLSTALPNQAVSIHRHGPSSPVPLMPTAAPAEQTEART
jgi:hypothetical protein